MKAIIPMMMPKKQANRDKIMKARVASQYAVKSEGQRPCNHHLFVMHE